MQVFSVAVSQFFFALLFVPQYKKNYRTACIGNRFYSDYFVLSHTYTYTWTHTYAIGYTIDSRTREPTNPNIVRKWWLKDRWCCFSLSLFLCFLLLSIERRDMSPYNDRVIKETNDLISWVCVYNITWLNLIILY